MQDTGRRHDEPCALCVRFAVRSADPRCGGVGPSRAGPRANSRTRCVLVRRSRPAPRDPVFSPDRSGASVARHLDSYKIPLGVEPIERHPAPRAHLRASIAAPRRPTGRKPRDSPAGRCSAAPGLRSTRYRTSPFGASHPSSVPHGEPCVRRMGAVGPIPTLPVCPCTSPRSARPRRPVRVLVVDDNEGFRESLVMLLDTEELHVVGQGSDGEEAMEPRGRPLPRRGAHGRADAHDRRDRGHPPHQGDTTPTSGSSRSPARRTSERCATCWWPARAATS